MLYEVITDTYKAYEYYEKLFFINEAENKSFLLKFDDIKILYGLVGSNIIYSMETRSGGDDELVPIGGEIFFEDAANHLFGDAGGRAVVISQIKVSDPQIEGRITSYNVCYTKLLRFVGLTSIHLH